MFCTKCGKEIKKEMKYCPGCGNPVDSTNEIVKPEVESVSLPYKKEVFIRGIIKPTFTKYGGFQDWVETIFIVIAFLFGPIIPFVVLGLVWYTIFPFIFRESILYDEKTQSFFYNANSNLGFTKASISINDVKGVWIAPAKFGILQKFYIISFVKNEEESLTVYFSKKDNMEEFIPTIEYAINKSGKDIEICRDDELIKMTWTGKLIRAGKKI